MEKAIWQKAICKRVVKTVTCKPEITVHAIVCNILHVQDHVETLRECHMCISQHSITNEHSWGHL